MSGPRHIRLVLKLPIIGMMVSRWRRDIKTVQMGANLGRIFVVEKKLEWGGRMREGELLSPGISHFI